MPTGTITLPGGLEVPESLSALLGLSNAHLSGVLVRAFVESTTDLLTLSEDGRKYLKGTGEAFWRKLTRELATRWPGVELGCLTKPAPTTTATARATGTHGRTDNPFLRLLEREED